MGAGEIGGVAVNFFKIRAVLGIDSTEFQAGLKQAESSLSALGKNIAAAFSAGVVIEFTRSIVNAAAEVQDLAEQFNTTTANIQAAQVAAREAGIEFNTLGTIMGKIRKAQADFNEGDPKTVAMFKRLGLTGNMSPIAAMNQIANSPAESDVIELIGSKNQKALAAMRNIRPLDESEMFSETFIKDADKSMDDVAAISHQIKVKMSKLWDWVWSADQLGKDANTAYDKRLEARGESDPLRRMLMTAFGSITWDSEYREALTDAMFEQLKAAEGSLFPEFVRKRPFARDTGESFDIPVGRDAGEFMGPTGREASMAIAYRGRELKQMERLLKWGTDDFQRVSTGDLSAGGGFYGPNVDINSKLNRAALDLELLRKDITQIKDVLKKVTE